MKIFLDTANREIIKKWGPTGLIDGITTNPSLLSKEGDNPKKVLLDICSMIEGPVSIEVVEKEPEAVYKQAKEISMLAPNVVVKIPCVQEYLSVMHRLTQENIKINVTLVFSAVQTLLVAKLGVTYISPFLGRWDDIANQGVELIDELVTIKGNYDYFEAEILAASIRSVLHLKQVALAGADIATVPAPVLEQAFKHPLTDRGIEIFDNDWKKSGNKNLFI